MNYIVSLDVLNGVASVLICYILFVTAFVRSDRPSKFPNLRINVSCPSLDHGQLFLFPLHLVLVGNFINFSATCNVVSKSVVILIILLHV